MWSSVLAFGQTWKDSDGGRRVPYVRRYSGGDFKFRLGRFEDGWYGGYVLLAFCDPSTLTLGTSEQDLNSLTLESAIKICKENGLTVTKTY